MSTQIPASNPTAYMGIKETNPPELWNFKRSPTVSDYKAYDVGDIWINSTNSTAWILAKKVRTVATWVNIGGAISQLTTLTGDNLVAASPVANNINILGGLGITTIGAANSITIQNIGVVTVTPDVGAPISPVASNINLVGVGAITTVTTAPDTIQIQTAGTPLINWSSVGVNTAMAPDNGYFVNAVGMLTMTLPLVAAQGTILRLAGKGSGGWMIAQNAGQSIDFTGTLSTTVGIGGSVTSTDRYDALELLCIVADTTWVRISQTGNQIIV